MDNIVATLKPIMSKKNREKEFAAIEEHLQSIKNRETSILVCGEFKRGKSSFINAFLEQELCPVDTNIATAVVSIIRYGEKARIVRWHGDFSDPKSETLNSLEEISRYVKGRSEESDHTIWLDIEVPNIKLKNGIVLIDTPGVGGLDPRHAFLTNYFMPKADIVLFVTDKDSPLSASEIDFYKDKIASKARQNIILVNKADLFKSEEEQSKWIVDVQDKCGTSEKTPDAIPISAKLKSEYLKGKDDEDLKESNFEALEKEIEKLTETFRKGLLLQLKEQILSVLEEMRGLLTIQLEQIEEPDPQIIERLENEMRTIEKQKQIIENPNSEYRIKINSIITQARNNVDLRLREESILLSADKLRELADSPQARENPDWLQRQMNNAIGSLASELDTMIDDAFAQVMLLVGSNTNSLSTSRFEHTINVRLTPAERSFGTVACDTARHALSAFGLGMAVAWLTGGVALPLLAGAVFLSKSARDASRNRRANDIIAKLNPQIQIATQHLSTYISSRFATFNQELLHVLQEGMQKMIENKTTVINSLTKLKAQSSQQKQLRAKLLNEELKPIENLMTTTRLYLSNPLEKS
jgi:GTPase Era involved in 16S rRNA processing